MWISSSSASSAAGAPLGLVLEGGYAPVALAASVRATLAELAADEPGRSGGAQTELSRRAAEHFSRYAAL